LIDSVIPERELAYADSEDEFDALDPVGTTATIRWL
jgi:hypothetical protein